MESAFQTSGKPESAVVSVWAIRMVGVLSGAGQATFQVQGSGGAEVIWLYVGSAWSMQDIQLTSVPNVGCSFAPRDGK